MCKMILKSEIIQQLEKMMVPRDSVILVHSSLRAVGKTEGRGEGLLDALREHITADGGLLCIPTHTWEYVGNAQKITLDLTIPETCIGTLPNIAAKISDVRSLHPTHSMAIFGDYKRAREFAKGEENFITPANPQGCYGKIFERNGYVLLIGVGHNRNTYLHCVEEMLSVQNRIAKESKTVTVKNYDGRIEEKIIYPHEAVGIGDVSLRYPKYEEAFRYHGAIVDGEIGNAKAQLCSARKMKEVMELVYNRSREKELMLDDTPLDKKLYM